jgi:hypothetical protein
MDIRKLNSIDYTKSVKNNLEYLKSKGVKKIFFAQDDVFSFENLTQNDMESLFKFVSQTEAKLISLEHSVNIFHEKEIFPEVYEQKDDLILYKTTTFDFKNIGLFAFDDCPSIIDLDYFIEKIYGEEWFAFGSILAESIVNTKFHNIEIDRMVFNKPFFKRINIVGPNAINKRQEIAELRNKFK